MKTNKMKQCFLFLSLLQPISYLCAQDKIQVHYNKDWNISHSSDFAYRREANFDFTELVFNGEYKDYDKGDHLIGEGIYINGVKTGIHKTYFADGKLRSSIEYAGEEFIIRDLNSEHNEALIKDGTGKFHIPFTIYKKDGLLKGEFKNYKKTGKWTYFDSAGKKTHEEVYKDNAFQKGTFFSESGETALLKKREIFIKPNETIESFDIDKTAFNNLFAYFSTQKNSTSDSLSAGVRYPGGIKTLFKNINKMIKYPAAAHRNGIRGRIIVTITVDKDGKVKKYEITKSVEQSLDDEAVRVLQLFEDKWYPSVLRGQAYESPISIPISFN
jgi:TonB family protein